MTNDNGGTKNNETNYWDQTETALDFNNGLTGKKLISPEYIKAEKTRGNRLV